MSDNEISDKDYQKRVERLDRLLAIGAISSKEWRDARRKLLGLVEPSDCARLTGLTQL